MQGVNLCSFRAAGDDGQKFFDVGDQNVRALHHLHGEAGVHDVAAREAEVQPAAGAVVDLLATAVVKPMTSWLRNFLQFLGAFGQAFVSAKHLSAPRFIFAKSALGTMPSFTNASLASSSI